MQSVLAIDVATALPAIVALSLITIPQTARTGKPGGANRLPSVLADMREGLDFIMHWRAFMLLVVIGIAINMLGRAGAALLPLLVTRHFTGGVAEFGWLQSAEGIGAVIGGVVLGVWGGFRWRIVTQMLSLALDGLAIIVIGLTPREVFPLAVGLLESLVLGLGGAIFQAIVPPEVQGRVFALVISATQALAPLGLLLAGPTVDAVGVQFWWLLTGAVITAMGAGALCVPTIVRIEDDSYQPAGSG